MYSFGALYFNTPADLLQDIIVSECFFFSALNVHARDDCILVWYLYTLVMFLSLVINVPVVASRCRVLISQRTRDVGPLLVLYWLSTRLALDQRLA